MERAETSYQAVNANLPGERLGNTIGRVMLAIAIAGLIAMFLAFPEVAALPGAEPSTFWMRTTLVLIALDGVVLGVSGAGRLLMNSALPRLGPGREPTWTIRYPRLGSMSLIWLGVCCAVYIVYLATSSDPLYFDPLAAVLPNPHDPRAVPWLFIAIAFGPTVAVRIAAALRPSPRDVTPHGSAPQSSD